jgi:type I restriction enzyme S subunit
MGKELYKKYKLRDIINLKYGKGLPKRERRAGEYPVYGSGGVVDKHIEPLVKGPGIIIGRKGSIGNVFYEKKSFYPIDTVYYVEAKDLPLDLYYLSHLLTTIGLNNMNSDAAVPGLNREIALSQEVIVPPHEVQRKIAAILSAYDDLIENNLRRIKILEEMAQNLYREWFVNFRFPGHEITRFVESPLGQIPEGWEALKLGDLINIRKGKNITKKTVVEGPIPVIAGGKSPAYCHNTSNTKKPIVTISASGANAGFVWLHHENVWASDCSVIDTDTTRYVYYYYLQLRDRKVEVDMLQRGAAQPHVYPKDLMELEAVKVPTLVLDRFNLEVSVLFQMIGILYGKNTILRQTRDLLLPKLISGEVDVSELDIKEPEEAAS